ncbi:unnamed protein product [Dovyalis caffra]|uniref:ENTH domain-containing protein n=1 Tax=Dovyalis caffra TaxID=77055 RepID=A0AAV1SN08_9ROSI|nr:unnamed protein product [Dovyalis caffra]
MLILVLNKQGLRIIEEHILLDGSPKSPLDFIRVQIANVDSNFADAISEIEKIKVEGRMKDGIPHLTKVGSFEVDVSLEDPIQTPLICRSIMDFMKVFDQTVREIKREVNLKVLKVPEIEQKVLDATDDAPWGPHGSALAEIAQATKKFTECQMIMNVLWTRLGETGKDWRLVYKALTVVEYLVGHGSDRAVDDIIEHTFQISSLSSFEYVEPNGKDSGLNVRKKAESIVALLNNRDKIQEVRNKAAANRDKYIGLSSSGISYKPSSASFGSSSSFQSRDRKDQDDMSSRASKTSANLNASDKKNSVSSNYDDDDFDPRGTSSSNFATQTSTQVDLFGESLIGDLMDAPTSVPTEASVMNGKSAEVDLFADAAFVSAPPQVGKEASSLTQTKVDLFASQPANPSAVPSTFDFFTSDEPVVQTEIKTPKCDSPDTNVIDPFAAVPMNNFDGSDLFGAFTSNSNPASTEPTQSPINDGSPNNLDGKSLASSNPPQKEEGFQVKSGIWADSLSRGLIDLNISAPKKVSLVDVGVVGDLTDGLDEREKGPPTSFYMGRAMGMGSGLSKSGFTSSQSQATGGDDFFSSLDVSIAERIGVLSLVHNYKKTTW